MVWRLDRSARSLRELIDLTTTFGERGVGLRSLSEQLYTTPGGRLLCHITEAIANFERGLIQEPTHAGLAAARARGRRGGRATVRTPDKIRTARELYDRCDMTVAAIAKTLGVCRATYLRPPQLWTGAVSIWLRAKPTSLGLAARRTVSLRYWDKLRSDVGTATAPKVYKPLSDAVASVLGTWADCNLGQDLKHHDVRRSAHLSDLTAQTPT